MRAYWLRSLQVGVIVLLELDGVEKQFMPQMQGLLDQSLFDCGSKSQNQWNSPASLRPLNQLSSRPSSKRCWVPRKRDFPDPADLLYWLVSQDRKIIRGERSSNERLRPLSHSLLRRQPDLLCWRSLEPGVCCYRPSNRNLLYTYTEFLIINLELMINSF